jgi:uncharacterized protein YndB with AHSA1/START domain
MTSERLTSVVVRKRFTATPERVFDAWLDPDRARQWLFTTADSAVARCEIDARVGGRFTIVDRRSDGDIEHVGEYIEIDRPRRLVFSFAVPAYSSEYDRVTVVIVPTPEGCELTLTNEMSPANYSEWAEKTAEGWGTILGSLDRLLGDTSNKENRT